MDYESEMTFPTPDAVNGLEDGRMTLKFFSQPTNYAGNKHLGISKSETYWKCYFSNSEAPDPNKPEDNEFSLEASTTDWPWRIDTRYIEAVAQKLILSILTILAISI